MSDDAKEALMNFLRAIAENYKDDHAARILKKITELEKLL